MFREIVVNLVLVVLLVLLELRVNKVHREILVSLVQMVLLVLQVMLAGKVPQVTVDLKAHLAQRDQKEIRYILQKFFCVSLFPPYVDTKQCVGTTLTTNEC